MATRVRPLAHADTRKVSGLLTVPGVKVADVPVEVISQTDGAVTWFQKIKLYYKGIVAFIGTVLVLLTSPEIGFLGHLLPSGQQHYLTIGIGVLTVLLTFLKENQHWFDDSAVNTPYSAQ